MPQTWLALKIVPNASGRRLVLSIPKRAVPLSTRRSRLKRLIRESIRIHGWVPPAGKAFNVIVRSASPKEVGRGDVDLLLGPLIEMARERKT